MVEVNDVIYVHIGDGYGFVIKLVVPMVGGLVLLKLLGPCLWTVDVVF